MNSLTEFLKYAKIEQDLNDTFNQATGLSLNQHQPYFDHHNELNPSFTAAIYPNKSRYGNSTRNDHQRQPQSSRLQQNSTYNQTHPLRTPINLKTGQSQITNKKIASYTYTPCKICSRTNHRTIDCFHKQPNGCFKCVANHIIRDCPQLSNFQ